jgi:hypothetical protein
MPHLILAFEAEREMKDVKGRQVPTGKDSFSFKMIDTDKGEVVELSADTKNVKQNVRQPNFAELDTASKALGKGVGEEIALKQYEELKAERDSYFKKNQAAETSINSQKRIISSLESEIALLKTETFDEQQKKILADALDEKIIQYAALQDFENYESAKKMYRKLTGHGWADDDEEGD